MATATTSKNTDPLPAIPLSGPIPAGLNDTRADDAPILGHFVDVVSGEYKGTYGVFLEATADGDAVVRSRDAEAQRLTTPISSLVAADAGKR